MEWKKYNFLSLCRRKSIISSSSFVGVFVRACVCVCVCACACVCARNTDQTTIHQMFLEVVFLAEKLLQLPLRLLLLFLHQIVLQLHLKQLLRLSGQVDAVVKWKKSVLQWLENSLMERYSEKMNITIRTIYHPIAEICVVVSPNQKTMK